MKKQVVAVLLAGGRVDELSVLTAKRPKSAVPIWGMYRFIDFSLSNAMRSGIDVVGVLAQYRPLSLAGHIAGGASWDYTGRTRELRILTPYKGASDSDWYKGTADAVWQNLNFLRRFSPEYVVVASGDHVLSMDWRPMIRQHVATKADLTIAFKRVPREQASRFGTAVLDRHRRVVAYEEKAERPRGNLASLTVYVFSWPVLVERLRQNAAEGRTFQIYADIIPRMVREGAAVCGYTFDGYWAYARTLDDYYATNMDALRRQTLDIEAMEVRTNIEGDAIGDPPPPLFRGRARVRSSLVGPGVTVAGTVERSILSPGAVVEAGAVVRDSVIMHDCRIRAGAVLERAILDKNVVVGAGARIGADDAVPNRRMPGSLTCGATVVGKDTTIPEGVEIGGNCVIPADTQVATLRGGVKSGTTVGT